MDSGWLAQDQAVIAYMKKLELHKYASLSYQALLHGQTQPVSSLLHQNHSA